jgi:putative SOS response-associated peptidase YedK
MCGRYASFLPAEAMARILGTVNPLPNLAPSWNVAPTQDAAVVRRHPDTGARHKPPAAVPLHRLPLAADRLRSDRAGHTEAVVTTGSSQLARSSCDPRAPGRAR